MNRQNVIEEEDEQVEKVSIGIQADGLSNSVVKGRKQSVGVGSIHLEGPVDEKLGEIGQK